MAAPLVLYTNPMSRGRIARWMLEEIGQHYTAEIMQYDQLKSPAYRAINPMGKVPALLHGDVVVTENAAICAYLADAFPDSRLAPPSGDPRRGAYYRWLFFAAGPLEAAVTNSVMKFNLPPERERMAGYGNLPTVLSVLEEAVSGDGYVAGDEFTAADLYLGSHIGFGLQFGSIEARPAFVRYWQRLAERPAQIVAAEKDDALISASQPEETG